MRFPHGQLAYCTNIHPAESWEETLRALESHTLPVRQLVCPAGETYAIGLRLSARAARELLHGDALPRFRDWLHLHDCSVFTINGFPFGDFHGTRVKEKVYQPDWTRPERLTYTRDLFTILAALATPATGGSVSTLPASFKPFQASSLDAIPPLLEIASFIDDLAASSGIDLHLGLEPEPFGHFENTAETLEFFNLLLDQAPDPDAVRRRIGVNYDSCHFALQYEDPASSLGQLHAAGIRISKIHLSAAIAIDPRDPAAIAAIGAFDEPTYLHQVIARHPDGRLSRHVDLPDALDSPPGEIPASEWRIHFHIPLDADPTPPLRSTRNHAAETLEWCAEHPGICTHFEIETYTWGVLPPSLRRDVETQIAAEYHWVLQQPR